VSVSDAAATESRKLDELVEGYFERYLTLNPILATSIGDPRYNDRFEVSISPEWRARAEQLEREYLERSASIDPRQLATRVLAALVLQVGRGPLNDVDADTVEQFGEG